MYHIYKVRNGQNLTPPLFITARLVVIFGFPVAGCELDKIDVIVENYLEFLEVTPEQEPVIKAMLITARNILDDYYKALDDAEQDKNKRMTKDDLLNARIDLLERLSPVMENISRELVNNQRLLWNRSELYYFYTEMRRYALDNYNRIHRLSFEKTVTAGFLEQQKEGVVALDPVEQWTIYFGLPMYSNLAGNTANSMLPEARGTFPIGIQATLMDSTLLNRESNVAETYPEDITHESVIEIRVVMSTRLHPNYVDIDNWIPFLELSNSNAIEPVKIVERDEQWFSDRELLLSNRIPEFLTFTEPIREAPDRQMPERLPTEQQVPFRSRAEFTTHTGYYQLFFPAYINNEPVISPAVEFIKLVFLEEIGSINRANGVWKFDWSR